MWKSVSRCKKFWVDYSLGHILIFPYTQRHFPHVRHFLVGSIEFLDNYVFMRKCKHEKCGYGYQNINIYILTKSSPKCRCGYGFMWTKPSPKEEETRFCLHQTSLNLTNGNKTKAKTDTIDTIACHCREEKPLICIKAPLFSSLFFRMGVDTNTSTSISWQNPHQKYRCGHGFMWTKPSTKKKEFFSVYT